MKTTLLLLFILPVSVFAKISYNEAPLWDHPDNPTYYYNNIAPADTSLPDSNKTQVTTTPPAEEQQAEQEESAKEKKSAKEIMSRLRFGGYVGASFGTLNTIEVAPLIGYMLTEKLMLGVGFSVFYTWSTKSDYEAWSYGPRFFARYDLIKGLFLHAEYELISFPTTKLDVLGNPYESRESISSVLVGGGINRGRIGITALYVVNYDEGRSPYANPWVIRFGVFL